LLLTVLATATAASLRVALVVAVAAMLAFNYFFLPPYGTLTIADPQNWVALFVFFAVAIVASQLSGALRRRSVESLARQRDLERLYALSRSLLLTEDDTAIARGIARAIADVFGAPGVALFDSLQNSVNWGGEVERPELEGVLHDVARHGRTIQDGNAVVTAIRLGRAPIGSLAVIGAALNDTVLQSVTNLVAIGLERARGQAASARAEAARQNSELRAALLDAVAHEFKTPLTSMKAAASALRLATLPPERQTELVDIVNEDLARVEALVNDAVQMLRIDAGDFTVHRERHRVEDILSPVFKEFEQRLDGHSANYVIPKGLEILADRPLVQLAARQLLDNALKYAPSKASIEMRADSRESGVEISVMNSGSYIPEHEHARVTERFYRGSGAHHVAGTGMGLAIVRQIVEAHGGSLRLESSRESGTRFIMNFPAGDGAV